jgi:phospholipid/cholesterol/gamma-HCH transport system ATP-binding protein
MVESKAILELTGVTVEADPAYDSPIWNVSLRLGAGELALVWLERGVVRLPLADVAEGLAEHYDGTATFLGRDWRSVAAGEGAALRGRIGRVFDAVGAVGTGWVSNLDVDENVMLAQRHHTRRPSSEIEAEAAKLARMFGLPGLPRGRPGQTRAPDLQRAACARAFVGTPDLILLERPAQGVYPDIMPPLINAVRSARNRGAAVVWLTDTPAVWSDRGIRPTWRCVMSGSQMLVLPDSPPLPPGETSGIGDCPQAGRGEGVIESRAADDRRPTPDVPSP